MKPFLSQVRKFTSSLVNSQESLASNSSSSNTRLWRVLLPVLSIAASAMGLISSEAAYALPAGSVTIQMVTDDQLIVDSNYCSSNQGPRSFHVGFKVTNTTGSTINQLSVDLAGLTNGFSLTGGQPVSQYIGSLAPGSSRTVYWYTQYAISCPFNPISSVLTVTAKDSNPGTVSGTGTIQTASYISASAGGQIMASLLGPGYIAGQLIPYDVEYEFGGAVAGDRYNLQPAGNLTYNAACFQLERSEVLSSTAAAVPAGSIDRLFFTATAKEPGSGYRVKMRYFIRYLCANMSTVAKPYAGQTSGNTNKKYTGNYETFLSPPFPAATNSFVVTKSASSSNLPNGGNVTYTITITNTSNYDARIDKVVDTLPTGVTFNGIAAGSNITAANSSSVPAAGSTGTIVWLGQPPAYYSVPANSSVTLIYTATIPNTFGSYTNSVTTTVGNSSTPAATSTVTVNPIVSLSGKVWDDADNSANNSFNNINTGTESGTNAGGLHVILVDSTGKVLATTPVAGDGTYTLSNLTGNQTGVSLRLSVTAGTVGASAPVPSVPNAWINTSPLSTAAFNLGTTNLTAQDFGIEQLPNSTDLNAASQTNPGGTTSVQAPTLAGTDPEDGVLGTGKTFRLFPVTNGTLYYNGTAITAATTIIGYIPTLLRLDPDDGAITASFTYAAIDAANQADPTPATVTMPFTAPIVNTTCSKLYGSYAASGATSFTLREINPMTGVSTIVPTPTLNGGRGSLAVTPDGKRFYFLGSSTVSPVNELKYYNVDTNTVVNTGVSIHSSNPGPFRMAIDPTGTFGYSARAGVFQRFQLSNHAVASMTVVDVGPASLAYNARPGGDIWFAADGTGYIMARRGGSDPLTQNDNFMYRMDINNASNTVTATFLGEITSPDARFKGIDANGLAIVNGIMYIAGGAAGTNNAQIWSVDLINFQATFVGESTVETGIPPGDATSCQFPAIAPAITAQKIVADVNVGTVLPGDELEYTLTIRNSGNISAGNVRLQDPIPAGTTYVANSTTLNGIAVADNAGDMPFVAINPVNSVGQLAGAVLADTTPGTSGDREAIIKFRIKINATNPPTQVSNQGTITYNGGPVGGVPTDDPTTPTTPDPTNITVQSAVASNPNLLLVKRMTALNNTTFNDVIDDSADPNDNSSLNWPATYLQGKTGKLITPTDTVPVKPNDTLEYTIYFLSTGNIPAKNVLICDRIPSNTTFNPNAYGSNQGILFNLGTTATPMTNVPDGDPAQYFPPGTDPVSIYPKVNCGGANTNGAIVINLGTVNHATAPGTPNDSYGFIRFQGKVK
jgi:uncharacterized repeat protein (TIGR01451 family)